MITDTRTTTDSQVLLDIPNIKIVKTISTTVEEVTDENQTFKTIYETIAIGSLIFGQETIDIETKVVIVA